MIKFLNEKKTLDRLFLIAVPFLIIIPLYKNLFFSAFNIDEVILYFTSRGVPYIDIDPSITHSPGQLWGSIFEMFRLNRSGGSLDPGMFTFILRWWSLVADSTFSLRLLPMLFFLLGIFFILQTLMNLSEDRLLVLLALFPFLTNLVILDHAFTLRPYSMEFCCVSLIIYLFVTNKMSIPIRPHHYKFLVLLLCFLLGSRYFVWGIYFLAVVLSFTQKSFRLSFKDNLKFDVLLPVFFLMFYSAFSLKSQLTLTKDYLLPFFTVGSSFDKFLSIFTNKSFWFFLSYPVLYFFSPLSKKPTIIERDIIKLFLCVLFLYLFLDAVRCSPFVLDDRFTIGFHTFSSFSLSLSILTLLKMIKEYSKVLSLLLISVYLISFHHHYYFNQRSDLISVLTLLNKTTTAEDTVLCDAPTCSTIVLLRDILNYHYPWDMTAKFKMNVTASPKKEKYLYFIFSDPHHMKHLSLKGRLLDPILEGSYHSLYAQSKDD